MIFADTQRPQSFRIVRCCLAEKLYKLLKESSPLKIYLSNFSLEPPAPDSQINLKKKKKKENIDRRLFKAHLFCHSNYVKQEPLWLKTNNSHTIIRRLSIVNECFCCMFMSFFLNFDPQIAQTLINILTTISESLHFPLLYKLFFLSLFLFACKLFP